MFGKFDIPRRLVWVLPIAAAIGLVMLALAGPHLAFSDSDAAILSNERARAAIFSF